MTDRLLLRLQQGDEHAFEQIYLHYQARVTRFLTGLLRSSDTAEDLTQDIFVRLWDKRSEIKADRGVNHLLFVMARNAAFNHLRREAAHPHTPVEEALPLCDAIHPEQECFAREIALLLEMAVADMPERRQRIYRLSREEGLTNGEIAERLGISRKTVENQLSLALRELRQTLAIIILLWICWSQPGNPVHPL